VASCICFDSWLVHWNICFFCDWLLEWLFLFSLNYSSPLIQFKTLKLLYLFRYMSCNTCSSKVNDTFVLLLAWNYVQSKPISRLFRKPSNQIEGTNMSWRSCFMYVYTTFSHLNDISQHLNEKQAWYFEIKIVSDAEESPAFLSLPKATINMYCHFEHDQKTCWMSRAWTY